MSDLRELYQEVILDHNKRPRNFGPLAGANRSAEGYNPLCGDRLTVHLTVDGDTVRDVSFEGSGCAISKASASLMTEVVKGRTLTEVQRVFDAFHHMVTSSTDAPSGADALGKLSVLSGVREFPTRVKCAILAWHTLRAAIENTQAPVTTE